MSEKEIGFNTPPIGFTFKTTHQTVIKEGETIIVKFWKWKKFGWIQKAVTMKDGKLTIQDI